MSIRSLEEVLRAHRSIVDDCAISCHGHSFVVKPGVFSPLLAPSGFLELSFAAWPIFENQRVLDIGSGSGISTCLFALNGAKSVVGVDINPHAIECGRQNAYHSDISSRVRFLKSDVFDEVEDLGEFDICFANLPFSSGHPANMLERAFFDPGLFSIRKFMQGIANSQRLKSGMRAFVCASSLENHDLPQHSAMLGLDWVPVMRIDLNWVQLTLAELMPSA